MYRIPGLPFVAVIVFALAAPWPHGQPAASVPPIPKEEQFVQQEGLVVSLILKSKTLRGGADPGLKVRFQNQGPRPIHLVPYVESNLRITTTDGRSVPPAMSHIASRVPIAVTRSQLIRLEPGRSWEEPVAAAYHADSDVSRGHAYELRDAAGSVLLLPPGEYVARFTYVNAPEYAAWYDPYDVPPDVWEGRLDAAPVRFTVAAPTREQLEADIKRLHRPGDPSTAARMGALVLPASEVIAEFRNDQTTRRHALGAARVRPPEFARELLQVIATIPADERRDVLYSPWAAHFLAEHADCYALAIVLADLDSTRGDLFTLVRAGFARAAPACPDIRTRLRDLVAGNPGDPTMYARGNAAALLGTFRNPGDVALLVDALDRKLPRVTLSPVGSDPFGEGAIAGLAQIGGTAAFQAIGRALADDQRAARLDPNIVTRIADTAGENAAPALQGALNSSNVQVVSSALINLGRLGHQAVKGRAAELIGHRNALVRASALRALREIGVDGLAPAVRTSVEDSDAEVQANALFYLSEHGEGSDLDLFVNRLESRQQSVREAAVAGVARFGRADTFPRLRKLLDIEHWGIHRSVQSALGRLTFTDVAPQRQPREWDEWYTAHRDRSRADWAHNALTSVIDSSRAPLRSQGPGVSAVSYLAETDMGRFRGVLEAAAASRLPALRIEAARAIGRVDGRRSRALLSREFDGRRVTACSAANDALNALARTRHVVDCTSPPDRLRAKQYWLTRP